MKKVKILLVALILILMGGLFNYVKAIDAESSTLQLKFSKRKTIWK